MESANSLQPRPSLHQQEYIQTSGDCVITTVKGKSGDMVKRSYPVFPGITLVYNEVHMQEFQEIHFRSENGANLYEINHCSKGRIETSAEDHFFYLSPGDLSIHKSSPQGSTSYFPTSHYHGVSILVDINHAPKCLSCFLDDVNVRPDVLMDKFCGTNGLYIARSNEHLSHVFSELYHIPEEVRKGYLKIKILEIFLFLSSISPSMEEERKAFSANQVNLAKQVCKFLMAHMSDRITIDDLSKVFHVSPTQLKNCFKGVYGVSLYSYIRAQKMQSAASMLLTTDKTVLEIANIYSYDNASKFAKAFSDVMGMSPKEYRKANSEPDP